MDITENIRKIKTDKLIPYEQNPKQHPEEQIDKIASSINKFGFKVPMLVSDDYEIIAGHGRLQASRKLGLDEVPVIVVDDLNEAEIKAFRIADNRLTESGWDDEKLGLELEELDEEDFDLELTGFEEEEMNSLLDEHKEVEEDDFEEPDDVDSRCEEGQVWKLGEHRLMCGDATSEGDVDSLMDGDKADMVFTDPPYGVDYSAKNEMLNEYDKGNRIQKDIEKDKVGEIKELLEGSFKNYKKFLKETNSIYITFAGSTILKLLKILDNLGFKLHQILAWVKNNHVIGRVDYASKHELIVYGWFGKHKFYGDFNTSVWEVDKPLKSEYHPTQKPIELISKGIKNSSKQGNLVLDLFGGSGSTLIACEQLDRKCYMMEIDPEYCEVIMQRWEELTGKEAELVS